MPNVNAGTGGVYPARPRKNKRPQSPLTTPVPPTFKIGNVTYGSPVDRGIDALNATKLAVSTKPAKKHFGTGVVPTQHSLDRLVATFKKNKGGNNNNNTPVSSSSTPTPVVSSRTNAAQRIANRRNGGGGEQFVAGGNGKGNNSGSSGSGKSGGQSGGKHPLLHRAKETIAAQMNPQLTEYQQEINDANTSAQQQQADLADLYRRLGVQLGANQSQGDAANAAALQGITDKYGALSGSIDSTYNKATADTNSELSRLGIQEVGPAATAQTGLDHNYLSSLTAIDKTNAQANSTAKSQSFDNLLGELQGQSVLAGTQDRAKVLRLAAQTVADLTSKKGALAATRRGAVDALYHQLKDAQTQRQADMAQQAFMNQIAAGKLGVEQGTLGVQQGKLALDAKNSSSQRDLRTAQALKYIHDSKRPYSSYSSSANKPQGYQAGLSLLQGSKTGSNAAAKNEVQKALSIYTNMYTKDGGQAITELEKRIKAQSAHDYMGLPKSLQAAVIDALRLAGAR